MERKAKGVIVYIERVDEHNALKLEVGRKILYISVAVAWFIAILAKGL
jgi:hypothetical protein